MPLPPRCGITTAGRRLGSAPGPPLLLATEPVLHLLRAKDWDGMAPPGMLQDGDEMGALVPKAWNGQGAAEEQPRSRCFFSHSSVGQKGP